MSGNEHWNFAFSSGPYFPLTINWHFEVGKLTIHWWKIVTIYCLLQSKILHSEIEPSQSLSSALLTVYPRQVCMCALIHPLCVMACCFASSMTQCLCDDSRSTSGSVNTGHALCWWVMGKAAWCLCFLCLVNPAVSSDLHVLSPWLVVTSLDSRWNIVLCVCRSNTTFLKIIFCNHKTLIKHVFFLTASVQH